MNKMRTRAGGPEDPREGLEAVVTLRRMLEALEAAQVENAFVAGWAWAQIAEVLGVSRQAVHKKHARRIRERYPGEPSGSKGKGEYLQPFCGGNPQVRGGRRGGSPDARARLCR